MEKQNNNIDIKLYEAPLDINKTQTKPVGNSEVAGLNYLIVQKQKPFEKTSTNPQ